MAERRAFAWIAGASIAAFAVGYAWPTADARSASAPTFVSRGGLDPASRASAGVAPAEAAARTTTIRGTARFGRDGAPARGTLELFADDARGDREWIGSGRVGRDGAFAIDARRDHRELDLVAVLEVEPGWPTLSTRATRGHARDAPLELSFPHGWFVVARCDGGGVAGARAWLAPAEVAPEDAREAEADRAAGLAAPDDESLWSFERWRSVDVLEGGRVGPIWIEAAPAYELAAFDGERLAHRRFAAPASLPPGATSDLGSIGPEPATGLEVRLDAGNDPAAGWSLLVARRETTEKGSRFASALAAIDSALADAVYRGAALPLGGDGRRRLVPIPEDRSLALRLRAPSGSLGPWLDVAIRPGEVQSIELATAALGDREAAATRTLRGRLVWQLGGGAIAGASVADASGASGETDADGRFTLERIPRQLARELRVERFDPEDRERAVTLAVELPHDDELV
ncbi:MAG TPA: hypothetical protein VKE69_09470, partial [Planctomycetota bacterium]|nr:hypothetical protein [Planctomycetota bacterium]